VKEEVKGFFEKLFEEKDVIKVKLDRGHFKLLS